MSATLNPQRFRAVSSARLLQDPPERGGLAPAGSAVFANPALRLTTSVPAPGEHRRLALASAAALLVFAIAVAGLMRVGVDALPAPPETRSVELVTLPAAPAVLPEATPAEPAPAPLRPASLEPLASPQPGVPSRQEASQPPLPPPAVKHGDADPLHRPPQPPVPRPKPQRSAAPLSPPTPAQPGVSAQTQAKEPPTTPPAPSSAEIAAFQAGMRRAVQAALVYPPAARMAGQRGQARMVFTYLDGQVSDVTVAAGTGLPMLDRAAVATVQAAHYPLPPPAMAGQRLHLMITVAFDPGLAE